MYLDILRGGSEAGSIVLTGAPEMGASACFSGLIRETAVKEPVWLFQNSISSSQYSELENAAAANGYRILKISTDGCSGIGFDILSLAEDNRKKAEIAYSFVYGPDDTSELRTKKIRMLTAFLNGMKAESVPLTLENLLKLDIYDAADMAEKEADCRFLEMESVKSCFIEVNEAAQVLLECGAAHCLSQKRDALDSMKGKRLVAVIGTDGDVYSGAEYARLANAMLSAAAALAARNNSAKAPYHVFVRDTEMLSAQPLKALMTQGRKSACSGAVCVYEPGIQHFLEKEFSLNDTVSVIAAFNSTGSDAEVLSQLCGTRLKPEISQSYGKNSLFSVSINTGGVVDRRHGKYQGMSVSRAEKRIYEARVFSQLKCNECIVYWLSNGRTGRKKFS